MLNIRSNGIPHHDWFVEVVKHNDNRFSFRCYHPQLEGFHNNGTAYNSYKTALIAGCYFIDREIALTTLQGALEELHKDGKISLEEYWNLTNFS